MSEALIIDDNRLTADALKHMLAVLNVPAQVVYSSGSAMGLLGRVTPSVVLLDINMPGVDGTEVLAYLRREPRLLKVPVIVVTSDDQPETRQRVMKGGANAFIVKPASLDLLDAALKKVGLLR